MPGLHITDHQMSSRQSNDTTVAAAKAGFSTATAHCLARNARIMTVASLELLPLREPGGGSYEAGQHGDEG